MKKIEVKNLETLPYGPEEALNRLRVNLNFCGDSYKKIMITSSIPDEGKSFVSANLWRMLAESGKNTVLVDADLRKSVFRSRYDICSSEANAPGLSYYLSGQADMKDIVYETNIPHAYLAPVFHTVDNPAVLLQTPRFGELLDYYVKCFDYVLIDTPPLGAVADGEQVAALSDGAILVVRGGFTPRSMVSSSIKLLERTECQLLGVVMNRVEMNHGKYYGKYGRYGKYGYYNSAYRYYGSNEKD